MSITATPYNSYADRENDECHLLRKRGRDAGGSLTNFEKKITDLKIAFAGAGETTTQVNVRFHRGESSMGTTWL